MLHSDGRCSQTSKTKRHILVQTLIFFASGAGVDAHRGASSEPARTYKAHGKHVIMHRSFCRTSIEKSHALYELQS